MAQPCCSARGLIVNLLSSLYILYIPNLFCSGLCGKTVDQRQKREPSHWMHRLSRVLSNAAVAKVCGVEHGGNYGGNAFCSILSNLKRKTKNRKPLPNWVRRVNHHTRIGTWPANLRSLSDKAMCQLTNIGLQGQMA